MDGLDLQKLQSTGCFLRGKACWIFEADYALAAVYKYAPEVLKYMAIDDYHDIQKKQLIIYVSNPSLASSCLHILCIFKVRWSPYFNNP